MGKSIFHIRSIISFLLPVLLAVGFSGCSSTRHLEDGQYLLWKNKISLTSDKIMSNKGEIKDNLDHITAQKANSSYMGITFVKIPMKLWRYNRRYKKLHNLADSLIPKTVERPIIYDSSSVGRSVQNIKNYLFNQGYFYATVEDTVVFKNQKAIVSYKVNAGANYLINRIRYKVDDSDIAKIILNHKDATILRKGKEFTYAMLEEERSRIAAVVANEGYRRFSLDNITFLIDTMEKSIFRVAGSPFENAVNYLSQVKSNKKSTLDIDVIVEKTDDKYAYNKYVIGEVNVYPDYAGVEDRTDTNMIVKTINGINFRYHSQYVRPRVLYEHIFVNPGHLYSKALEDKTTTKLGELGIFQSTRVQFRENRETRDTVDCNIFLTKTQKHDFSTTYEISNGTTYALGNSLNLNYRNKNFMKGANVLSISLSGGIETFYNETISENIFKRFPLLTTYYGVNGSLDFPKFLAPIASSLFTNSNLPHTIVSAGENVIDRINYFRLINSSANFSYSWHQTQTKTWVLSPAFANIIRLPLITDSFDRILKKNLYLQNSYKKTFIQGENISFKFDDNGKRQGLNYSYVRLAFEEAGSLISIIDRVGAATYGYDTIPYAQYTKFDFDGRHYFALRRSVVAFRLYGGIGTPYGNSAALPYTKQYFSGGPYSLRGWRIRTLGPGSYFDTSKNQLGQIDRTGDIKMELNGEYRFPITPLFAGAIKMNGAFFADAGNIWLSSRASGYPGGELAWSKLGQDIAMDMGVGSRFDIASFLTLRVDVAIPVKKPYILTNKGWVFDAIDMSNPTWRKDNVVLNVSIGYPF
jgi:outer membrane protein insertion porin family